MAAGLKSGDTFPDGVSFMHIPYKTENSDLTACGLPQKYNASAELKKSKAVIVAFAGAFTPTCQESHLSSYKEHLEDFKAKGYKIIGIASNDTWVMAAWAKANGITSEDFLFMSDSDLAFSKSLGWASGDRAGRYAIVVDHGKVVYAAIEKQKGSIEFSGAETVLSKL